MALKTLVKLSGKISNNRVRKRLMSDNHHPLSTNHLLINYNGRKTGKPYSIPVNYKTLPDGKLVIGTEGDWWVNLKGGADVEIVLRGETMKARAEPIVDDPERRASSGKVIAGPVWRLFYHRSLIVIELTLEN